MSKEYVSYVIEYSGNCTEWVFDTLEELQEFNSYIDAVIDVNKIRVVYNYYFNGRNLKDLNIKGVINNNNKDIVTKLDNYIPHVDYNFVLH